MFVGDDFVDVLCILSEPRTTSFSLVVAVSLSCTSNDKAEGTSGRKGYMRL